MTFIHTVNAWTNFATSIIGSAGSVVNGTIGTIGNTVTSTLDSIGSALEVPTSTELSFCD